ncbi:hypothetical protein KBTX_00183 [wastewater metagenome]|uniref:DUF2764 family protein n=2 Tax=unclassified sequences TaxID=12908 RepID=A0A5B8R7K0_9ZZZZ|nr:MULTISPECIES: hypothetical protein [Arhodomonas]MCS4505532.1 hypothetical protein [Arhodomonas aquaeolei]QEA03883.1 hypothetical protein KBTEX_00183 [uncultured organism]
MSKRHEYVMLLASLPALPGQPFGRETLGLSRLRLDRRLGLLGAAHRESLDTLLGLLDWCRPAPEPADTALATRADAAMPRLAAHGIADLAEALLEIRTVVAALRARRRGHQRPTPGTRWGVGPRIAHMRTRWDEPLLGVGAVFPWLAEARAHLEGDRPLALERLLMTVEWRLLDGARRAGRFDFRAVTVYVLRWRIAAAWRRYNAEAAEQRLRAGVHHGLGGFRNLFAHQDTAE